MLNSTVKKDAIEKLKSAQKEYEKVANLLQESSIVLYKDEKKHMS